MKFPFTAAALDALPTPAVRTWHRDAKHSHLALCHYPSGRRALYWSAKHEGASRQIHLGDYPALGLPRARALALEASARSLDGKDPNPRPAAPVAPVGAVGTLEELFGAWEADATLRGFRSLVAYRMIYRANLAPTLGARPVANLTRADFRAIHARIGGTAGKSMANHVIAIARAIMSWGVERDHHPGPNPAGGIRRFRVESRERRLSAEEVAALLAALHDEPSPWLADFVLLLLLTGVRRSNLQAARWEQIDLGGATWRIPMTKNGKPHVVPLEAPEIAILEARRVRVAGSPWVFPSPRGDDWIRNPQHAWISLRTRAGLPDLRLHDLRRSLASFMLDEGVPLDHVGKMLGHSSPASTAVYARLSLDPVRVAKRTAHAAILGGG